jgi:hypothetical protein
VEQPEDRKKKLRKMLDEVGGDEIEATESKPQKKRIPLLSFVKIFLSISLLYTVFIKDPSVLSNTDSQISLPNTPTDLCWPKLTNIGANKKFRTEIMEEGPNRSFMVSLYAVDHKTHNEILEWFDENKRLHHNAGFTMIPNEFKLDSVMLEIEDM